MRTTKALLLAAAISAVGLVTSMAQVYSVNIVGYVNTTITGNGFSLIANPLNASPDNTVASVLPAPPRSITIYKYRPASGDFAINTYDTDFGWDDPTLEIAPGQGFFVFNGGAEITLTFVGEVPTGTQTIPMGVGFNMVGSKIPQSGLLQTDLGYTPSATGGDTIYKYRPATGDYAIISYDPDFGWDPEPTINVGEGFWVLRSAAGSWTRTFNVN